MVSKRRSRSKTRKNAVVEKPAQIEDHRGWSPNGRGEGKTTTKDETRYPTIERYLTNERRQTTSRSPSSSRRGGVVGDRKDSALPKRSSSSSRHQHQRHQNEEERQPMALRHSRLQEKVESARVNTPFFDTGSILNQQEIDSICARYNDKSLRGRRRSGSSSRHSSKHFSKTAFRSKSPQGRLEKQIRKSRSRTKSPTNHSQNESKICNDAPNWPGKIPVVVASASKTKKSKKEKKLDHVSNEANSSAFVPKEDMLRSLLRRRHAKTIDANHLHREESVGLDAPILSTSEVSTIQIHIAGTGEDDIPSLADTAQSRPSHSSLKVFSESTDVVVQNSGSESDVCNHQSVVIHIAASEDEDIVSVADRAEIPKRSSPPDASSDEPDDQSVVITFVPDQVAVHAAAGATEVEDATVPGIQDRPESPPLALLASFSFSNSIVTETSAKADQDNQVADAELEVDTCKQNGAQSATALYNEDRENACASKSQESCIGMQSLPSNASSIEEPPRPTPSSLNTFEVVSNSMRAARTILSTKMEDILGPKPIMEEKETDPASHSNSDCDEDTDRTESDIGGNESSQDSANHLDMLDESPPLFVFEPLALITDSVRAARTIVSSKIDGTLNVDETKKSAPIQEGRNDISLDGTDEPDSNSTANMVKGDTNDLNKISGRVQSSQNSEAMEPAPTVEVSLHRRQNEVVEILDMTSLGKAKVISETLFKIPRGKCAQNSGLRTSNDQVKKGKQGRDRILGIFQRNRKQKGLDSSKAKVPVKKKKSLAASDIDKEKQQRTSGRKTLRFFSSTRSSSDKDRLRRRGSVTKYSLETSEKATNEFQKIESRCDENESSEVAETSRRLGIESVPDSMAETDPAATAAAAAADDDDEEEEEASTDSKTFEIPLRQTNDALVGAVTAFWRKITTHATATDTEEEAATDSKTFEVLHQQANEAVVGAASAFWSKLSMEATATAGDEGAGTDSKTFEGLHQQANEAVDGAVSAFCKLMTQTSEAFAEKDLLICSSEGAGREMDDGEDIVDKDMPDKETTEDEILNEASQIIIIGSFSGNLSALSNNDFTAHSEHDDDELVVGKNDSFTKQLPSVGTVLGDMAMRRFANIVLQPKLPLDTKKTKLNLAYLSLGREISNSKNLDLFVVQRAVDGSNQAMIKVKQPGQQVAEFVPFHSALPDHIYMPYYDNILSTVYRKICAALE